MKKEEIDIWEAKNDLIHEDFMDDYNIVYRSLPDKIKKAIIAFDKVYEKALKDAFIDEEEEKQIILESYKITQLLKQEYEDSNHPKHKNGGDGILEFVLGIALGALGGAAVSKKVNL